MYSILFLLIIILSIILIKLLKIKSNIIFSLFLTLTVIYFIINPKLSMEASLAGAKLFFYSVLPTMFPFMVICNMIINLDGIKLYSKILGPILCRPLGLSYPCSFALVASFLCGYPLGAKYSTDLYKKGIIRHDEFLHLLNIASNIGPLFLLGAVGTSMLGNSTLGYLLLIPSYLSVVIMGIITKNKKREKKISLPGKDITESKSHYNIGEVIKKSIEDASLNILVLCGYVIMFSVVISMVKTLFVSTGTLTSLSSLLNIPEDIFNGLFLGGIEVTNGCNIIASSNLSILSKLSLISFLSSFGGLSIIAQTSSFFYKENVSILKYFLYKVLQGIISFVLMFFIYMIFKNNISVFLIESSFLITLSPLILIIGITLGLAILYKLFIAS
ncbi:sporulation integral membrane protein YlbJ [Clostridium sp. LIBA-8841]|uniref:sporulation integral membrane protein YlbJ n=1 Tax=Clostridium sp. LIBA-8841 TaxID=2987530 RepID=UPI002AC75B1D|nr:sporulation integral membrane protein YlbJ [Clostridium sp. LIBA-8841]MDZ5252658.1 sporulation integral membrane protein YlbJ [Clostridium sp. LIBA-8841]